MKINTKSETFRLKNIVKFLVSFVLMVGPLAWIFFRMNKARFLDTLIGFPYHLLSIVILIFLFLYVLQGIRLWVLLRPFVKGLSFRLTMSVHFESLFYSVALPGAAQDLLRAALLSKEYDYRQVWSATWIAKLLTLVSFCFFAVPGSFMIDLSLIPPWAYRSAMIMVLVLPLALVFSFSKSVTRNFRPIVRKFLPSRISSILEAIRDGIYVYKREPAHLAYVIFLTALMHFLTILNATIIIYGIMGEWHFKEALFFIPVIEMLVISLPFTPNGIGIREGFLSVFFLQFLGKTSEQLGVYVTICFLAIVLKVVGFIPVVLKKRRLGF